MAMGYFLLNCRLATSPAGARSTAAPTRENRRVSAKATPASSDSIGVSSVDAGGEGRISFGMARLGTTLVLKGRRRMSTPKDGRKGDFAVI